MNCTIPNLKQSIQNTLNLNKSFYLTERVALNISLPLDNGQGSGFLGSIIHSPIACAVFACGCVRAAQFMLNNMIARIRDKIDKNDILIFIISDMQMLYVS